MSTCAPPASPPASLPACPPARPPVVQTGRDAGPHGPAPEARPSRLPLRRLGTEFALFGTGVLAYFAVRGLTETDAHTAQQHAARIVALERNLGAFVEPAIQRAMIPHDALVTLANWVYIWGHWPVIAVTAVWLAVRRPDGYRFLRNAMLLSGLLGIAIFVSYPVAPPRLAGAGLLDTVVLHSDAYRVLQPPAFVNQYAALPSLHVGWDLLVGLTIFRVASGVLLRAIGLAMPVLMAAAVVVTGNHYLLDVAAGVALALTAAFVVTRISGPVKGARAHPVSGRARAPLVHSPAASVAADSGDHWMLDRRITSG